MEPDALRQKTQCHKQKIHQTNRRQNKSGNREVENPNVGISRSNNVPLTSALVLEPTRVVIPPRTAA